MMPGLGLGITRAGGGGWARAAFATQLAAIFGSAPVAGYLPDVGDVLTSTDPWNGGTWTADATMVGQITAQGRGWKRALASASSRYLTRPDAANQSFGNGTTDSPFTLFYFGSITDTAAIRTLIAKNNTANLEYRLIVTATDTMQLILTNAAQDVVALRATNAAITQGAPHLFWSTYSGLGGATAATGIVLGMDGGVLASTAFDNAGYVAMTNLAAPFDIGANLAHTVQFGDGDCGLAGAVPGAMSLGTMTTATALCTQYFGSP